MRTGNDTSAATHPDRPERFVAAPKPGGSPRRQALPPMRHAGCAACGLDHGGGCPPPTSDRRIGQRVGGKYEIVRRLACGGMGTVYEARHVVVGRHFAIKFLHHHFAQRRSMVQRFLREAQATGSLASEHLIGVLDFGTHEGAPYLVMELVRGQDLRELIAETPRLAVGRAVRIVLDACRGLSVAHERGLVHRDLKPANLLITRSSDGRELCKVIDFGVAKLRDASDLSEEGTLIGTVGYMAPEQLTGDEEVDVRADVYALGVILYQALAGRPPHVCSRSELLFRVVALDPGPLKELRPDVPPALAEEIHRALSRSRHHRHASVEELARALEPYALMCDEAPAWSPTGSTAAAEPHGLGNAQTELESAPTWAAPPTSHDPTADRNCETPSPGVASSAEGYCRLPDGVAPAPPTTGNGQQLSQRALMLSLGALALSVVAIAMMFVFVYSHGAGALRPGPQGPAKAPSVEVRRASTAPTPGDDVPGPPGSPLRRTSLEQTR